MYTQEVMRKKLLVGYLEELTVYLRDVTDWKAISLEIKK